LTEGGTAAFLKQLKAKDYESLGQSFTFVLEKFGVKAEDGDANKENEEDEENNKEATAQTPQFEINVRFSMACWTPILTDF